LIRENLAEHAVVSLFASELNFAQGIRRWGVILETFKRLVKTTKTTTKKNKTTTTKKTNKQQLHTETGKIKP